MKYTLPSDSIRIAQSRAIEEVSYAYNRHCIAGAKYDHYAQKIQMMGYESLSNFFAACSFSELVVATKMARISLFLGVKLHSQLVPGQANTIDEMVEEMLGTELEALREKPAFLHDAIQEGFAPIILIFRTSIKADESQQKFCDELKLSDDYWLHEEKSFRVCTLCGFVREPCGERCPICGAAADLFAPFPKTDTPDKSTAIFAPKIIESLFANKHKDWRCNRVFPNELSPALDFFTEIANVLADKGWSEKDQFAINLALTETATNAVEHGNQRLPDKKIFVECTVSEDFFFFSARDEGPGFDPDTVPNPTLDEFIGRPHGRGIMLINALMSRVWFDETGSSIKMIKVPS